MFLVFNFGKKLQPKRTSSFSCLKHIGLIESKATNKWLFPFSQWWATKDSEHFTFNLTSLHIYRWHLTNENQFLNLGSLIPPLLTWRRSFFFKKINILFFIFIFLLCIVMFFFFFFGLKRMVFLFSYMKSCNRILTNTY